MKALFLIALLVSVGCVEAQNIRAGNNVGREYGNPKMPLVVSHLAGSNKERLKRANKNSRHSILGKILCFRKLCRIQSGHAASLRSISFKKFQKKIARNTKKGNQERRPSDSTNAQKPVLEIAPSDTDRIDAKPVPIIKADSLIVLGAELLFETNKSTLRSEHFTTLNSIVDYLVSNPERGVKISGHSDNTGSEEHNLMLSKKRADVVAEYLVDNGVDIHHVETFGFGSTKPMVTNTSDAGRKKNRRVELLIHDRK